MSRLKKIIRVLTPPLNWRLPVLVASGVFFGIGSYALVVSNVVSYMSDAPETCINCHVMGTQYVTWFHSSHRENATCNDCHVPQDNILKHYAFKAQDGIRHAYMFTMGDIPDPIIMHEAGQKVVQANCQRCHDHTNQHVTSGQVSWVEVQKGEGRLCWDCHRDVPHGTVRSSASVSQSIIPVPQSPMPEWLKKLTK